MRVEVKSVNMNLPADGPLRQILKGLHEVGAFIKMYTLDLQN